MTQAGNKSLPPPMSERRVIINALAAFAPAAQPIHHGCRSHLVQKNQTIGFLLHSLLTLLSPCLTCLAPNGKANAVFRRPYANAIKGIGWEFVHVCIDDASRVAFVQVMQDGRKERAAAFMEAAVAYYAKLGICIERVITDSGSCYRSKALRTACKRLGLRQVFTRPCTPKGPHRSGQNNALLQSTCHQFARKITNDLTFQQNALIILHGAAADKRHPTVIILFLAFCTAVNFSRTPSRRARTRAADYQPQ